MELEKQVCSLELAKRLKELNCRQESAFYWVPTYEMFFGRRPKELKPKAYIVVDGNASTFYDHKFAAFTCSELGEMLPHEIKLTIGLSWGMFMLTITKYEDNWFVKYEPKGFKTDKASPSKHADTEADARCAMLIYLIEKGIVDASKIK